MIHQISIKNFKSLHCVKNLPLKPLTIIIGPNASGKSNLLDALEAMQQIVRHKGTIITRTEDEQPVLSLSDVLWRKAEPAEEIVWEIACTLNAGEETQPPPNVGYCLAVRGDDEMMPVISSESLKAKWPPFEDQEIPYLSRRDIAIEVQGIRNGQLHKEKTDISPADLALHSYARTAFHAVKSCAAYIKDWEFFKIVPDKARLHTYRPNLSRHSRLGKYGGNLSNVLHYLREEKEADFNYIQEEISKILNISELYTRKEERKERGMYKVHLDVKELPFAGLKPFSLNNLSDGTVGLLTLLTVLNKNDSVPLICIEEPERSIHPKMLSRLAGYLHEAVQHTQLMITTHNADFLDHFDPYQKEYVQVLVAYRDKEHATRFAPISDIRNVKAWLEDYMLGQIWTMGQLEEMLEVE
ncbi:MAG: ATP-binding protein [Gammaproteobacteria bacterium]|nr:ATP-binding protein [Gammaproteobacteria bacterium]